VSRRIIRVATAAGAVVVAGFATGCTTDKQVGQPYPSLGDGMTILLFVILPLAIFGTIALLAALPSLLHRPRYRPGRPWDHDPLWFGGPDDPENAIAAAQRTRATKGGASAEW
jgi:hypothetical protein